MALPHSDKRNAVSYSVESLKKQVSLLEEQVALMDKAIGDGFEKFVLANKNFAPNLYELRREAFGLLTGISTSQKYKLFNFFIIIAKQGHHPVFLLDPTGVFVRKRNG